MKGVDEENAHHPERPVANGTYLLVDENLEPLHRSVSRALDRYLNDLEGERCTGLFSLVISEVERPLLECVMAHVDGNQTRAADMLGVNRGTLRKKLKSYGLLED